MLYRGRKAKNYQRENLRWDIERAQGEVFGATISPTEFERIKQEYEANEARKKSGK